MFGLKKYKVLKDFCNYKKGQIVAFNGADAERFAKNISVLEPLKVVNTFDTKAIDTKTTEKVEEVKEEVKEQPKKRTYRRRTKKVEEE